MCHPHLTEQFSTHFCLYYSTNSVLSFLEAGEILSFQIVMTSCVSGCSLNDQNFAGKLQLHFSLRSYYDRHFNVT